MGRAVMAKKKEKVKPYLDVVVYWRDPVSIDEWDEASIGDTPPGHLIRTIGQLVDENESALKISLNMDTEDHESVSCSMIIPRVLIEKIKFYKNLI